MARGLMHGLCLKAQYRADPLIDDSLLQAAPLPPTSSEVVPTSFRFRLPPEA